MRILAVDDDEETLELVGGALRREQHDVVLASDVPAASRAIETSTFDVIVLDVMLHDASGLDLCAALRRDGLATPILFLSARGTVRARVDGLEAGGDDYLPKPFALRELLARVKALGRRGPSLRQRYFRAGTTTLDFDTRHAAVGGTEIPFTAREWDVLRVLADAGGRVVSFDDILERAWGDASEGARHSLGVLVTRIRKKLEANGAPQILRTARGHGYALGKADA